MASQSTATRVALILGWYGSNMTTLFLNRALLTLFSFRYPLLLTLLHMITCTVLSGALAATRIRPLTLAKSRPQILKIAALSSVFCAAVVLGNVSLRFIPVSFNQAISATSPAFTAFLALVMQGKRESAATYAALLPIVGGIMVASRFEPSFNVFGFGACLSAAALRALKTVIGEVLLTDSEKMSSLALLSHMAPIAAAMLLPLALFFEPTALRDTVTLLATSPSFGWLLLVNCLMAYAINLLNFLVTHSCGGLTLQVLGNAKGVVAAAVSIAIFRNSITALGCAGYAVTMLGVGLYNEARRRSKATALPVSAHFRRMGGKTQLHSV